MLKPGDECGEFELRREIGRGAMGTIWEARQPSLDRDVAVKVLSGPAVDVHWVQRFQSEAAQAARLSHPGILPVYAFGESGGYHWFAMELVEGEDLAIRLARNGPLASREAAAFVRDAARALHHAHVHGVIHRDVKPANLMVHKDGRVVVADFGLAKHLGSGAMTLTGTMVGTPYYMSPELVLGKREEVGPRSDVYGLGVTLYELLAGRPPLTAENTPALVKAIVDEEPMAISKAAPSVPGDLDTIVHAAMEKRPERRYASAAALADDLDRFLAGEPLSRRPPGLGARVGRFVERHRKALLAAAVALVVAVGALLYFMDALASKDEVIRSKDREIQHLLGDVDDLLAEGDIEGAGERLDELQAAGKITADEARNAFDRKAQDLVLNLLTGQGLLRERGARSDLLRAAPEAGSGAAAVAFDFQPPEAKVEVMQVPSPTGKRGYEPWETGEGARTLTPGFYRFVLRAPGRHTTVLNAHVPDGARGSIQVEMPEVSDRTLGMVHIAGYWGPDPRDKAKAPRVERRLAPYFLDARKVNEKDYVAFVDSLPSPAKKREMIPQIWKGARRPRERASERPIRGLSERQAKAYAAWKGKRIPTDREFKNAVVPALVGVAPMAVGQPGRKLTGTLGEALRDAAAHLLEREGLRDMLVTVEGKLVGLPEWVEREGGRLVPSELLGARKRPPRRAEAAARPGVRPGARKGRDVGLRLALDAP